MSYGVGCRCSSDPAWLWLWCRQAVVAVTRPLAWEPLYAVSVALKKQKKKKGEREIRPISECGKDSWGFTANGHNEGMVDGKSLRGGIQDGGFWLNQPHGILAEVHGGR